MVNQIQDKQNLSWIKMLKSLSILALSVNNLYGVTIQLIHKYIYLYMLSSDFFKDRV